MASAFDNGVIAVPVAADTTEAAWAEIAVPEGARRVHIRLKTVDAFIVPTPGETNPDADGCSYPVNCPIVLPVCPAGGNGKIHHKRDGGEDGEIHCTFYGV